MNQFDEREIQTHISILGWLFIVEHAFLLVLAGLAFTILPTIGAVSRDPDATVFLSILGTGFGVLMVVLALPGVLAGYGLLTRKAWGRVLALVVGILGLVNFPIGTAVGIYTVVVLMQRSANDYFKPVTLS